VIFNVATHNLTVRDLFQKFSGRKTSRMSRERTIETQRSSKLAHALLTLRF
jgi:hypothetical protein